jgi:hypothetical protein
MKRKLPRKEKKRWAKWLKAFMAKTVEQIRADYDGK